MMRLLVIGFVIALGLGSAVAQQSSSAQYAIKDDDGERVADFDLAPGLADSLAKLPAQVPVGNLQGDVTLLQFYDLNCPYCREAARDIDTLVRADKKLNANVDFYSASTYHTPRHRNHQ